MPNQPVQPITSLIHILARLFLALCLLLAGTAALLPTPVQAEAEAWAGMGALNNPRFYHTSTLLLNGKVLVTGGKDLASPTNNIFSSAELYNPYTNIWTATASMATPRYYHTATVLPNGKVLVAGGFGTGLLASAELYDPSTGTWAATGSMTVPRYGHTATLLADGTVLVAGGSGNLSAEIYNPFTGHWTPANSGLSTIRRYHTATLMPDGRVLVAGGDSSNTATPNYLNSAEIYTPSSSAWAAAQPLTVARKWHAAILLPTGLVLVTGGESPGAAILASAELYNPSSNTWQIGAPTPGSLITARRSHTLSLLPNGKVLVIGGRGSNGENGILNSTEVYNPTGNTWTSGGALVNGRTSFSATLLPDGRVLAVGGCTTVPAAPATCAAQASTEAFEMTAPTWTLSNTSTQLNIERSLHASALLGDGRAMVVGGTNGGGSLASTELFTPESSSWENSGPLNTPRFRFTLTLLANGKVLAVGGKNGTGDLDSAELFNTFLELWTPTASLKTPRSGHTATLLADGKVLVAGGQTGTTDLNSAELFDPTTRTWSDTGSMSTARSAHTATLLPDGKVLVVGGTSDNSANFLNSAELYDPITQLWLPAAFPVSPRGFHTATLLSDGQVLVVGGTNGTALVTTALYNPATNSWASGPPLTTARYSHSATLLANGKVLVAGGQSGSAALSSAEVYDPARNIWSPTPSLAAARFNHTAVFLADGQVLVAGGTDLTNYFKSTETYNRGQGYLETWRPVLSGITGEVGPGKPITISGSQLRGYLLGEASGGSSNNSATSFPLVQLRSLENSENHWLDMNSGDVFSPSSTTGMVGKISPGPALLTVFVNGIPSRSWQLMVPRVAYYSLSFLPMVRK